jgi:hypothetical protein
MMNLENREKKLNELFGLSLHERFEFVHSKLTINGDKPIALPVDYGLENLALLYLAANPDEADYFDKDTFKHFYENPGLNGILTLLLPDQKLKHEEGNFNADDLPDTYLKVWLEMSKLAQIESDISINASYDENDDIVILIQYKNDECEYCYDPENDAITTEVFEDFNDFAQSSGIEYRFIIDLVDEYFTAAYLVSRAAYNELNEYSDIPGY